jgi:hypothetical protein
MTPDLHLHSYLYSANFGRIPADARTVEFHQKLAELGLKWPYFTQVSQKSTNFGRKVRPNFGRNSTVQVLAEYLQKLMK